MKLSVKTALIVSVLSLTLSAHANGETQTQANVEATAQHQETFEFISPMSELRMSEREDVESRYTEGGGWGGSGTIRAPDWLAGNGMSRADAARVQANHMTSDTSANAAKAIFTNSRTNELVDKVSDGNKEKDTDKGQTQDNQSDKNWFDRLVDRFKRN